MEGSQICLIGLRKLKGESCSHQIRPLTRMPRIFISISLRIITLMGKLK